MRTQSSLLDQLKRIKVSYQTRKNKLMESQRIQRNPKRSASQSQSQSFQKDKQASHSKSDLSTKIKKNKKLFKDLNFCIPIKDLDLSPKVIQATIKSIEQCNGIVIKFQQNMKSIKVNYILCSRNIKFIQIEKKIDDKIKYQQILDYKYIRHCLNEGKILPIDKYLIYDGMDSDFQNSQTVQLSANQFSQQQKNINMSIFDSVKKKRHRQSQGQQNISKSQPKKSKKQLDKNKFVCQKGVQGIQKHKQQLPNNTIIIQKLQQLQKIYTNQRDIGRKLAYMKAISAIKTLTQDIQSADDIKDVRGIGPKIRDKIKQLLDTGILTKLDNLQKSQKNIALGQLTKVWGLGPAKATQLYQQYGIKSIQDLRKNKQKLPLTKNQLLGLKYQQQFQQRIPRQRVTKMFKIVQQTLYKLVSSKNTHYIECCGSYRRGKQTCGDMDIIITRRDGVFQKKLLVDLINKLQEQQFLTDHLTLPRATDHQSMSYMGVCQFKDKGQKQFKHHRIDIKNYPMDMFAFAILYFTGSDAFNRSMRLFARQKGLSMSDKGFVQIDDKGKPSQKYKRVKLHSQEEIFKYLGLDYKKPQQRSV